MNEIQQQWKAKVAAWVHDPAEKALVLLRDRAGHEGGTTRELRRLLFGEAGMSSEIQEAVRRADRWAAAADRPQFPRDANQRYATWAQVDFAQRPVLIHPLSGTQYDLFQLKEIGVETWKAVSFDHFQQLVCRQGEEVDWERTCLKMWRLGPMTPARDIGALWEVLPADTRVPDHSIWEHLRLTSALAGIFARGDQPALLGVSFGPVQSFIEQARSTSDLWAGSHLLSNVAWEGMRVVCETLGPDSILFPDLFGLPLVDLWLTEERGIDFSPLPRRPRWMESRSDANPLFAAALPNRFVALVPSAEVSRLTGEVEKRVRDWSLRQAGEALRRLLKEAGLTGDPGEADRQIEQQLAGFPEVYWAAVDWPDLEQRDGRLAAPASLERSLAQMTGVREGGRAGFFATSAWELLSREIAIGGSRFFLPNPGVVYEPMYELLERVSAAAKAARPFGALSQKGYRCTLCGEREWLTIDRRLLEHRTDPEEKLWASIRRQAWVREGERLCAVCMLKRIWPALFVGRAREHLQDRDVQRYVVSTHAMALAPTLAQLVRADHVLIQELRPIVDRHEATAVALPRRLAEELRGEEASDVLRRLPDCLDRLAEERLSSAEAERDYEAIERLVHKATQLGIEKYYALLLMDGDRMGAWLSGAEGHALSYEQLWHPDIRAAVRRDEQGLRACLEPYLEQRRCASPARHAALSRALNAFSLHVAPAIVEDLFKGKVLYAGGDDLLAMVSIDDLLGVMLALRCAYSGVFPLEQAGAAWQLLGAADSDLRIGRGYALHRGRLLRMMGWRATASMGAVVAHHTAPLGTVLRTLRGAEKQAKQQGGRDAFSLALLKRSGGCTQFTSRWLVGPVGEMPSNEEPEVTLETLEQSSVGVLLQASRSLAGTLSRRAAYDICRWMPRLPPRPGPSGSAGAMNESEHQGLLRATIARELRQHLASEGASDSDTGLPDQLAETLVSLSGRIDAQHPLGIGHTDFIANALTIAEFFAREGRSQRRTSP